MRRSILSLRSPIWHSQESSLFCRASDILLFGPVLKLDSSGPASRVSERSGSIVLHSVRRRPWYRSLVGRSRWEVLMPFRFVIGAVLAALLLIPSSGKAQVLMQRDVSLRMALTIAEAALAECGIRTSVAVVDRAGRLRVFLQGDGASPHNIELARRKAYTALTFRRTSADWAKRTAEGDITGQRSLADVIPLGGGVPIMIGEEAIGSVGLSGAPGGQPMEEACAKAGIAKVQDQLK